MCICETGHVGISRPVRVSGWLSVHEYNFVSAILCLLCPHQSDVCVTLGVSAATRATVSGSAVPFSLPCFAVSLPLPPPLPALSGLSSLMKQSSPSILLIANPFLLFVGAEPFSGALTAQLV